MITKELLKAEIDQVEEKYLEALYTIIQALRHAPAAPTPLTVDWKMFVSQTYGILADDPIEQEEQGA